MASCPTNAVTFEDVAGIDEAKAELEEVVDDVGHPDVLDFIRAKREDGRLRQFNLSLLITDDFMQAVRDDRSLIRNAFAETLRHTPPVQMIMRQPAEDVEMHGVTIPAGSTVTCLIAGANRDPSVFDDPHTFRIDRNPNPQLSFGIGEPLQQKCAAALTHDETICAFAKGATACSAQCANFAELDEGRNTHIAVDAAGKHSIYFVFIQ